MSESALACMEVGTAVGELARGLFEGAVLAEVLENGRQNIAAMTERTKALMAQGVPAICEAAFSYNGLYCAVDILKRDGDGWQIYEVKAENNIKEINYADVAYQKYVLTKCGVNVTGTYIVHLNGSYVRHGDIELNELFAVDDCAEKVAEQYGLVETVLGEAQIYLRSEEEPKTVFSSACGDCPFHAHCFNDIPTPSVFDLRGGRRFNYANKGIISLDDLQNYSDIKGDLKIQTDCLCDNKSYINKQAIAGFLKELTYPLYFLDFETEQHAIPKYDNSSPYQQIPFQYSLHYIEEEGGALKHKEFLGDSVNDPRRAIAERLVRDIPQNACVLAYYSSFEGARIQELAQLFPDLSAQLLNIKNNLKDLAVPFKNFYYYVPAMGRSYSIKYVLPALFPGEPSLDYSNLQGVHNGSEAMNLYPKIADLPQGDAEAARENLLKYCELDTYAMVKIWQELVRASK